MSPAGIVILAVAAAPWVFVGAVLVARHVAHVRRARKRGQRVIVTPQGLRRIDDRWRP